MPNQITKQVIWQLSNWNKYNFILFRSKRRIFDIFYKNTVSNANIVLLNIIFILIYFARIFIMYLFSHFSRIIDLRIYSKIRSFKLKTRCFYCTLISNACLSKSQVFVSSHLKCICTLSQAILPWRDFLPLLLDLTISFCIFLFHYMRSCRIFYLRSSLNAKFPQL